MKQHASMSHTISAYAFIALFSLICLIFVAKLVYDFKAGENVAQRNLIERSQNFDSSHH